MSHLKTAGTAACFFVILLLSGCGPSAKPSAEKTNPPAPSGGDKSPAPPATYPSPANTHIKPISGRAPNPTGTVPIAMYHHVGDRKDPVFVTSQQFIKDLTRMEKLGFRPVTMEDYLAGCPNLPEGVSPIVITFDDSNGDQIRMLPDGSLDPTCFAGLWLTFTKDHPDFPMVATFFVLPEVFFRQPKFDAQKLALVRQWGCELANHTVAHRFLNQKSDAHVQWEIAAADTWLVAHGEHKDAPLALPYGVAPKNKSLLAGFVYQDKLYRGQHFAPRAVLYISGGPAIMPNQPGFDHLKVPRIPSGVGPGSVDSYLTQVEEGKTKPYVAGPKK